MQIFVDIDNVLRFIRNLRVEERQRNNKTASKIKQAIKKNSMQKCRGGIHLLMRGGFHFGNYDLSS